LADDKGRRVIERGQKSRDWDKSEHMISQTVEYALRSIVTIAQNSGRAVTAREIAATTKVPAPYLSKLMQLLVRGGLVTAQRGPNGGFQLARDPATMTLWEVVNALEPFQRITSCPLGLRSHGNQLCPLHSNLDRALGTVEQLFRSMTVADMLSQPGAVTPLCEDVPLLQLSGGILGALQAGYMVSGPVLDERPGT
jgi:Rrf2 family nitric oxide-sensitive transcriptional repressor